MDVKIVKSEGKYDIRVVGRIDSTTYVQLQNEIQGLDLKDTDVSFDFRDVEYISSSGLRVLLSARKSVKGKMQIVNVSEFVNSIFTTTGFDSFLDIKLIGEESATYINLSFKDLMKQKAGKNGDKAFIIGNGQTYTWKEIDQCSQIVASDLFKLGVKKGAHVGLCSANSVNWIITFIAIQKLGAIACLMNFNYGINEILDVADVADITFLCYGEIASMKDEKAFLDEILNPAESKIETCYDIRSTICYKDRLSEYGAVEGLFDGRVESDDACVMIYTSGSTGKPKGVLLSAYNILNASASMADTIQINAEDKLCLILPLFHIFGMTAGLFCNVLNDGMIILPESLKTDTLLATIADAKCTLFHSVPTMILAVMNNKSFTGDKVGSLRATILAGAPTTKAQITKMIETFPNNHFICAYGLSEMAPVSITDYGDSIEHICETVGKPVKNIQIKIQDTATGETCGTGTVGEIIVEGYNTMSCYYKAALDVQSIDDSGWLHTGDLGYMDENGYIHLTGRAKELIIRGGENIMPQEVAEAISQHPAVSDVKVVGVPDEFFGEIVCACIHMKDGGPFDEAEMKTFLADKLAAFKIPSFFVEYDAFPVLSSGKVDLVNLRRDAIARYQNRGK